MKINGKSVMIGFGGPGGKKGGVGGFGVFMGHERQLFRLDLGPVKTNHQLIKTEIANENIGPDSYHVYDFGGGPR